MITHLNRKQQQVEIMFFFSFLLDERFFYTKTPNVKPRFVVTDARIYFNICILREQVFQRIHSKLASGSDLQLNFMNKVRIYIHIAV